MDNVAAHSTQFDIMDSVWPKTSFGNANFVGWAQDVPNKMVVLTRVISNVIYGGP